ncbi:MAG: ABC transporter permease [Anaerolineales bacterium]|nr:ABC transporter permease [Anaerolineales bacterium]
MKKKTTGIVLALVSLLALWWLLSIIVDLPILPSPLVVIITFFREIPHSLGGHFLVSLWRVTAGIFLSVIIAAPLGLILGQSEKLNAFFSPLIYILYPIPKVVFVPLILLFLGINDLSKIVVIFFILFFQILVLVRDQSRAISSQIIYSVRSLGAGRRGLFRFVYLPASLPGVFTALRQSIGTAVAVLYIVELIATQKGLGYYIYLQSSTLFNYPRMYSGVFAMSILGLGLYFGVDLLARRICNWQNVDRNS